jgi:tetratricopeptide (TPR) repeat protein
LLDLWDGRWDELDALVATVLATSRRTGNRWDEWAAHYFAGRVRLLRGELEPALKSLEDGLAIVVDGGAAYFELWVRPELARTIADGGGLATARAHLERCTELVGNGEDWRGGAGRVALAEGVLLAFEERLDEANVALNRARASFQRYRLPADEADVLHQWGRALGRAGEGAAAAEKLDEALELLRRHNLGPPWLERVARDRDRFG